MFDLKLREKSKGMSYECLKCKVLIDKYRNEIKI